VKVEDTEVKYYLSSDWGRDDGAHEIGGCIAINSLTGERLALSVDTIKLLKVFGEAGNTIGEAARHLKLNGQEEAELAEAVNRLARCRLLVTELYQSQQTEKAILPDSVVADCRFVDCEARAVTELAGNDIVVFGLPIDLATSGSPGARYGPKAIREGSRRFATYERHIIDGLNKGWYNADLGKVILNGARIVDAGDILVVPGENFSVTLDRCYRMATQIFQADCKPIFLGGDHSISAPLIRACAERYSDLAVLHLDAHADNAEWAPSTNHHHGNVISRILAENKSIEVYSYGVRGFSGPVTFDSRRHVVRQHDIEQDLFRSLSLLPKDKTCYISFDIDVLDPVFAPGTGTPVPLGMEPRTLLKLLKETAAQNRVVGIDVVELAPARDVRDATTNLVTHILLCMAALAYDKPEKLNGGGE